jgi:urease gamma subunit
MLGSIIIAILFFVGFIALVKYSSKRQQKRERLKKKAAFAAVAKRLLEIIRESQEIINKTKNLDTLLSRYNVILEKIDQLKPLTKEFPDLPIASPDEMRSQVETDRTEVISKFGIDMIETAKEKSRASTKRTTQINILDKALVDLVDIKKLIENTPQLDELERQEQEVRKLIDGLK